MGCLLLIIKLYWDYPPYFYIYTRHLSDQFKNNFYVNIFGDHIINLHDVISIESGEPWSLMNLFHMLTEMLKAPFFAISQVSRWHDYNIQNFKWPFWQLMIIMMFFILQTLAIPPGNVIKILVHFARHF